MDQQLIPALVDTGAAKSCMSNHLRRRLNKVLTPPTSGHFLRLGNGELTQPLGCCTMPISISGITHIIVFTVLSSCVADLILGWDFLSAADALIDCASRELHLSSTDIIDDSSDSCSVPLQTDDDYIVPPHSALAIILVPDHSLSAPSCLVEPLPNAFTKKNIIVPYSLVAPTDDKVFIFATNPSPQPQILPRGTRLATITEHFEHNFATLSEATPYVAFPPSTDVIENVGKMIDPTLTVMQHEALTKLLTTYHNLFDFNRRQLAQTSHVQHHIDTGAASPIHSRPYRISSVERREVREHVQDMLEKRVIEPSHSPWSSPVVLVKKKDGSSRFCVDYRRLNKITKKDVYPLPRIDDTLDTLQGSSFFSAMDLRSGYWQIPVADADRPKTAFITPDGLYQFNVMPFGLCNAPATFERMMDTLLRGLTWKTCLCYLDDVVVFAENFEQHLQRVRQVLDCFQSAGLQLNSKKCIFGARQIKVLGHIVSIDGVRPDPQKTAAVSNFPQPMNLKDVRSFLGLCTYFRRFIPGFSNLAEPLNILLRGNTTFHWSTEQTNAFEGLKTALTTVPILGHFVPGADTEIRTDASGYGIGAVLAQTISGTQRVIAYASRTLTKCERNYSITERECLAVVWAISKFRPYLYGTRFSIVTDHHALCWLATLKDPSGRLGRWSLKLQDYDFTVLYKSGKRHLDADSLSRCPLPVSSCGSKHVAHQDTTAALETVDIAAAQSSDVTLRPIIEHLNGTLQHPTLQTQRRSRLFVLRDGILYRRNYEPEGRPWLLVVPSNLQREIIQAHHDDPAAGHLGFSKTYFKIRRNYFWTAMTRTISKYVRACHQCQTRKTPTTKPPGLLQPLVPPDRPFQRVGIDFLGPFPRSATNNKWIIVAIDHLTRYAETKCVPAANAQEVAHFFLHSILLRHGAPQQIISDRGTPFVSKVLEDVLRLASTVHSVTTAYHPQTNGLTERLNLTLANMISMYVSEDHTNWDTILPFVTYAYNTARQATTGYSPYYLLYAREPLTPLDTVLPYIDDYPVEHYIDEVTSRAEDARQLARIHTFQSQQQQRLRHADLYRPTYYNVGDEVLLWTPSRVAGRCEKLMKRFVGPFHVLRQLSPTNYEVAPVSPPRDRRSRSSDVVHIARMKPYHRQNN